MEISLDGNYTVFGQVISGMDVVDKSLLPRLAKRQTQKEIKIEKIEVKDYTKNIHKTSLAKCSRPFTF